MLMAVVTQAPFTLRSIFGTARIKLVPVVPYHVFGSWTTYLDSPRNKKVVRYQKSSVVKTGLQLAFLRKAKIRHFRGTVCPCERF
jgi:hypothetical protein